MNKGYHILEKKNSTELANEGYLEPRRARRGNLGTVQSLRYFGSGGFGFWTAAILYPASPPQAANCRGGYHRLGPGHVELQPGIRPALGGEDIRRDARQAHERLHTVGHH